MLARFGNLALGIWLMVAPGLLGYSGASRINHLVIGPIIATFSVIGMWEVARDVRLVNIVLGIWLVISSFILPDHSLNAKVNGVTAGILVTALSLYKGKIRSRFNGGWRMLFRSDRNERRR